MLRNVICLHHKKYYEGDKEGMNEHSKSSQVPKENFVSALSVGVFLVLIGIAVIATPGFFDKIVDFFMDFDIVRVPNCPFEIFLPAPRNPANYTAVYSAATLFSFAWGIFLIAMLGVRIFARSPLNKKAENVSDIVFWLLGSFLINSFLDEATDTVMWFAFWALVITLIGVLLIVRAVILAAFK